MCVPQQRTAHPGLIFVVLEVLFGFAAGPGQAADTSSVTRYYCPWADMVLRIVFDQKTKRVSVTSGDSVPTPGVYEAIVNQIKLGDVDIDEIQFAIPGGRYWYTFDLRLWRTPADTVKLNNTRVNRETGETRQQLGTCFIER